VESRVVVAPVVVRVTVVGEEGSAPLGVREKLRLLVRP
jgi:hypothetical protein